MSITGRWRSSYSFCKHWTNIIEKIINIFHYWLSICYDFLIQIKFNWKNLLGHIYFFAYNFFYYTPFHFGTTYIFSYQIRKMKIFARSLLAQMTAYSVSIQPLAFGLYFSRNFQMSQSFTLRQFLYSGCYSRIFCVFLLYIYFFYRKLIVTEQHKLVKTKNIL